MAVLEAIMLGPPDVVSRSKGEQRGLFAWQVCAS
jgi:hypothetical protein